MSEETKTIFNYKLYGLEGDYDPLPAAEQIKLVKLYRKDRTKKYLNKLIQSNFRFILHMVKQFQNRGLSNDDLITIAYIGFECAVMRYRYNSNKTLVNYAALWIKQKIRKALVDNFSLIRIPVGMWRIISMLNRLMNEEKTDREIMKEMCITHDRLVQLKMYRLSFDTHHRRLGQEVIEGEDLIYEIPCEDELHKSMVTSDMYNAVRDLMHLLNDKEKDIIIKRYGLDGGVPMTLGEIGQIYGRSRERIRQMEGHALNKLRKHLEKKGI